MNITQAQLTAIAAAIQAQGGVRRGKKAKKGEKRVKLTDEQKVINAKANAAEAEKLFTDKGFKNCVAHETIKTYDKWMESGRKVRKGEKSTKTSKGVALFHLEQTELLPTATN